METKVLKCNQVGCNEPASFRYTWPGKDEKGICANHSVKLQQVASAMGLYVQLVPLSTEDE